MMVSARHTFARCPLSDIATDGQSSQPCRVCKASSAALLHLILLLSDSRSDTIACQRRLRMPGGFRCRTPSIPYPAYCNGSPFTPIEPSRSGGPHQLVREVAHVVIGGSCHAARLRKIPRQVLPSPGRCAAVSRRSAAMSASPPEAPSAGGNAVAPSLVDASGEAAASGTAFAHTSRIISGNRNQPDQGKPLERVGRKATGLRSATAEYGRRATGRTQHLLTGCASHKVTVKHWLGIDAEERPLTPTIL
jgi:hypothetical protein